jgi:hypothetical protein
MVGCAVILQIFTIIALFAGTTGIRYFQGKTVDNIFRNPFIAILCLGSFIAGMIAPLAMILSQAFSDKPAKIEGYEATRQNWLLISILFVCFMGIIIFSVFKFHIKDLMLFWS